MTGRPNSNADVSLAQVAEPRGPWFLRLDPASTRRIDPPYRYEGRWLDVANHRHTGHARGRPIYSYKCRWFVKLTQRPALRSRLRRIHPSASRTVAIPTIRCSGGSVARCLATPTPRCDDHSLHREGRLTPRSSGRGDIRSHPRCYDHSWRRSVQETTHRDIYPLVRRAVAKLTHPPDDAALIRHNEASSRRLRDAAT